jgi:hypothetical protein
MNGCDSRLFPFSQASHRLQWPTQSARRNLSCPQKNPTSPARFPPSTLSSTFRASSPPTIRCARTRRFPPSGSPLARRAIAAAPSPAPSTTTTSPPSRRPSPIIAGRRHYRPALPGQGHARALRACLRHGAGGARRQWTSTSWSTISSPTRLHPTLSHAILTYNAKLNGGKTPSQAGSCARRERWLQAMGRWHRDYALAQSARRRRLQVQPAQRWPGRHHRHQVDQDRANELIGGRLTEVKRIPFARAQRLDDPSPRLHHRLRQRPGQRHRLRPAGRNHAEAGRRPAGRRGRPLLAAHRGEVLLDLQVLNPYVDPTFRFMTLDWDGTHSHGLFVSIRHGEHDREQR